MSRGSRLLIPTIALAVTLGGPAGCSCGADAERAAAERAKIKKTVESSFVLVPYRALKVVLRSTGLNERAPEIQKVLDRIPGPERIPARVESPDDARQIAGAILDVAVQLYEARALLARQNEDELPLLWKAWTQRDPPAPWYGNDAEHLALATAWTVGEVIDKGNSSRAHDFTLYELSRAAPREDTPLVVKLWGRLSRGLGFAGAGYHYAADEELTRYVDLAESLKPEQDAELALPGLPVNTPDLVRAAGRLARAWNRIGLRREKLAVEDLEKGLEALQKAGVDNELTQWGWAFVYYTRGKFPEASQALEKLAASPHLDEPTKAEIRAAATDLKKHRPSIFGFAKAGSIIGGALLARAGGLDEILSTLVGDETAGTLKAPARWLDLMRDGVAEYATGDSIASGLRERAKETGAKGLDLLKQKAVEVPNLLKPKLAPEPKPKPPEEPKPPPAPAPAPEAPAPAAPESPPPAE